MGCIRLHITALRKGHRIRERIIKGVKQTLKNKVPFILNFNVGGVLAVSRYDAILSGLSVMCSIVIGSHCTVEAHSVLTVLIGRRVTFA